MEHTGNVCFVCDKTIHSEKWMYKLQETATKKRNVPVVDLIKQLVGDEYVVFVGEQDAICSTCMNMLNLMDSLTAQLGEVQSTLSHLLHSKYDLASDTVKIQYDDTKLEEAEPIHKCETCNFETKYEKEFNMHVRIHEILTSPVKTPPKSVESNILPKVKSSKRIKGKKLKGSTPRSVAKQKKSPQKKTPKQKKIPKPKKTKVVYQCSICDKIFPEESKIREHAKKEHGNDNIVVSDEEEYEDIQTLESDEEIPIKKSPVNKNLSSKKKLTSEKKPPPVKKPSSEKKPPSGKKQSAEKKQSPVKKQSVAKKLSSVKQQSAEKKPPPKKKLPKKQSKKKIQSNTRKSDLDFLDDWEEDDENGDIPSPIKKPKIDVSDTETTQRKSVDEIEDDDKDNVTKPTCMFCKATFSTFESVQDHIKLSHGKQSSHWSVGPKIVAATQGSIASFEIDSTTDILDKKPTLGIDSNKSPPKTFKCNLCGIRKVSLQFIQRHIKIHKKILSLQCKFCGILCKRVSSSKIHSFKCTKIASNAKKCIYCKFKFFDKVKLKNHVKKVHYNKAKIDPRRDIKNNTHPSKIVQTPVVKASNSKKISSSMNALEISISEVSSTSFYTEKTLEKENPSVNTDISDEGKQKEEFQSSTHLSRKKVVPTCEECGITFLKQSTLIDHMNRHKAKTCWNLGICIYCSKLFVDKEQLALHTDLIHSNFKSKPALCEPCCKTYLHGKDLKNHFLKMHFSEKTEKLMKQMSEHTLTNDDDNDVYSKVFKELQSITGEGNESEDSLVGCQTFQLSYFCAVCTFSSTDKNVLQNHFKSHKQNYCDICQNLFLSETFITHIENHSIEFQSKKCVECGDKFHDDIHLRFHYQMSHEMKPFKCSMCVKTFNNKKTLVKHESTMHRKTSRPVYFCSECPKSFHSEKRYQIHVGFAHRPIMNCKYCDKSFTEVNKLAFHERHHLKQVKSIYKCNVCGKVLKSQSALKTHKNNHTSNNSMQCEVCEQSFKSFHALREHMAKHSEEQEKKYFCDICGKGFYFYDSHARHRRVHLDPLLFRCRLCSERFQTKLKLIEHKKSCKVVAKCDKCLECFDTISDLKNHVCLFDDNSVALS
ncbi:zinc finger protein 729-like [Homalodisca vitripennis]|uniref:zinc finger protein 729-like n=1 Tax=Homalodisca vitripennis TaxID=197043 RepID=UPI001EEA555D|nr:zinc finger protein 729-like [Homalodisca vitripennis]XP_046672558.1 zinc finger protein 729-like [Homalodisca vitripennis]KAG8278748.1 hypothetical protein J6590_014305 [Homalodisca vitripennis]